MKRSNRMSIVGRTGSGKTQAGVYQLSRRDLKNEAWLVLDFKGDELINEIPRARHIDFGYPVSRMERGIFVIHPRPDEKKELEDFLWDIWEHGNIGIYCDEGYMTSNSAAFEACLTQGRSKRIPMIVLSQRPVWVSRFVFSESDFIQLFDLTDKRDMDTVRSFMPNTEDVALPEFHSWYFDVGRKQLFLFTPVPNRDDILRTIEASLHTRKI